ncbi:hypothetical protein [Roseovarius nanhaiticus]|uniref:hypothetical protein n=1 Tax=Roseovarius nanhaiticus TaxID=573024 RepID=UPI00248FA813|nr:hypothetical protein [Roseovarius nanhaiticus]
MGERPVVNFHIGAPRLASDVIHALARTKLLRGDIGHKTIAKTEFQKHLRGIINSGSKSDLSQHTLPDTVSTYLADLQDYSVVVGSQHAMLGHPKEVLSAGLLPPYAVARSAQLCKLLADFDLNLHLVITNQLDYLTGLSADFQKPFVPTDFVSGVPSWTELVHKIQAACPNHQLIVWDFERPESVLLPFALAMFNIFETDIQQLNAAIVRSLASKEFAPDPATTEAMPEHLIEEFDDQYERDLLQIETIENTILFRSDSLPQDMLIKFPVQT